MPLPPDLLTRPSPGVPANRGPGAAGSAAGAGPQFGGFAYQGGPIVRNPQVTTSFWGALWSDPAHQARAARLGQFHADLLRSGFMNVLSQYGVGTGVGSGAFLGSTFVPVVADLLTDADVRAAIQAAIGAGTLREPSGTDDVLMIYLDESKAIDDPAAGLVLCDPQNDTAFGYHSFFTTKAGHRFYYAVVPGLTDACLAASCPGGDAGCSLSAALTIEQRQTQVASHEFAEMVTDPELNGWFDPDPNTGENGDLCNGQGATITVGGNTWTVQLTFSKADDQAGIGSCLATAPAPKPKLPSAP